MEFRRAAPEDFPEAMKFIRALWDYNTYEEGPTRDVYEEVLQNPHSFAFFLIDHGEYVGFCHGDYFLTFWMCGMTCYVSSIITKEGLRHRGYGKIMMDHAIELAKENNCRAVILDSGIPRKDAHQFYENYGFEKSCYGFEMKI
ncbi:MAG: GNAT family N-acetyltransferase [Bilifractor sp.]|jgi:ribosomal protein S18 acetylase RimI-like enzyme